MIKLTIGEICEKLDILNSLENKLRDGATLNSVEQEETANLLSEYSDLLLRIKVEF